MLEYVVTVLATLLSVGAGFALGRISAGESVTMPKLKRAPKPRPLTVRDRKGAIQKVEEKPEHPVFKEPGV